LNLVDQIFTSKALISISTLTLLEIILGIDNIVMISIFTSKLKKTQREIARKWGLLGALVTRILLLFSISFIMGVTSPLFTLMDHSFSLKDFILLFGGLFLLYKASSEIYSHVELKEHSHRPNVVHATMTSVIIQIMLVDLIFSLDSVITAVGVAEHISHMVIAVLVSIAVMLIFAKSIGDFIEKNPSVKVLALSFLVLIGVLLIAEGFGEHLNKGYMYFGMTFSLFIELLNLRRRVKKTTLNIQ